MKLRISFIDRRRHFPQYSSTPPLRQGAQVIATKEKQRVMQTAVAGVRYKKYS